MQSSYVQTTWTTKRLTWTPGESKYPAIAIDSNDNLYVVLDDRTPGNQEIFFKKSTDGGVNWPEAERLTWSSGNSFFSKIVVDSSDRIHVVWNDNSPGNSEIYYKRSTNGGDTWVASSRLTWNSGDSWDPSLALDSSNRIHLAWLDKTPGNNEIYHKRSTDGGMNWGNAKRLTWNSGSSNSPAIIAGLVNTIHVVWYDFTPGNYEIFYKKGIQ